MLFDSRCSNVIWTTLHNQELQNLKSAPSCVLEKSLRIGWAGNVEIIDDKNQCSCVFGGKN
jgi:hypothetical protein